MAFKQEWGNPQYMRFPIKRLENQADRLSLLKKLHHQCSNNLARSIWLKSI